LTDGETEDRKKRPVAAGVRPVRPEDRKTLKDLASGVIVPSFQRPFACSSTPVGGEYGWIVGVTASR
jgi:hypothetical protein